MLFRNQTISTNKQQTSCYYKSKRRGSERNKESERQTDRERKGEREREDEQVRPEDKMVGT